MAIVRLTRLEVWSDLECAGGTRLGFYKPPPASAQATTEINGEESLRLSLYRDTDSWDLIVRGRVVRAALKDGSYFEYRIADVGEDHEADGKMVAEVDCESPLYDLGADLVAHELESGEVLHDFPLTLTPTQHINIALEKTDGFTSGAASWWSVGTVDFTAAVPVNVAGFTALAYLRELQAMLSQDGVGSELEAVRNGTTGYTLNLRTKVGATAETARLRWNRNLHGFRRTEQAKDVPTRVYPVGASQDGVRLTIGNAQWVVAGVVSNTVSLSGSPIGFDDQLNGLYLERADGTLIAVVDTDKATQSVVLASTPGLAADDLVWFRRDAAGHALTYLDNPGQPVRAELLERPDIPGVDNLVPNPFLDAWSGGMPAGFLAVGTPTITQVNEGGKYLNGSNSAEVVCLSEEEGIETDWIDVSPTARSPFFCGQIALYPVEGVWRAEILGDDGSAEGVTIPDAVGTGKRAYTDVLNAWVERIAIHDQATNFYELGITRVKVRCIADRLDDSSGQASCYFDAAQLAQTSLADLPFYGARATRDLWAAGIQRLLEVSDGAFQLEVSITDLYRMDSSAFPFDELVLGGTVEVQDPKLGLVEQARIRKIVAEWMDEGATQIELSTRPDEVSDIVRRSAGTMAGTLHPPGAAGAVDGNPLLDEDNGNLYLVLNRGRGAKSERYIISDTAIAAADVLASTTTSDSADPIFLRTFTPSEDRTTVYVGVAFHPSSGGGGKAGTVYVLTPYTYFAKNNRPEIRWKTYPGPKPSITRVGLSIVDDGDQVAGYARQYTDGDTPPAYTRNPVGSGFVSDPHEYSVDVTKPASDADPDSIFEAYAVDDQSNESLPLRLRVRYNMTEVDEPRVFARLDEDNGALYLTWDPNNPYGVDRLQYLDSSTEPSEAAISASTDFDDTGRVLVHTFDPNGAKTQTTYVGFIPQSADSGGRDLGSSKVIPYTYRAGNDRPTVTLSYQDRATSGYEKWVLTVLDDGDQVALYYRVYDKGASPPAYTRSPASGFASDPLSEVVTFVHPAEGDPNKVIEAYAIDDTSPTPLESEPLYRESDPDNIPTGDAALDVDPADNEAYFTPKTVDTDALSWRFRFSITASTAPAFNDAATDEVSGTAFGGRIKVSSVASAISALKDGQVLYLKGYVFNTSSTGASEQSGAVRSEAIELSIPAVAIRNALKSVQTRWVTTVGAIYPGPSYYPIHTLWADVQRASTAPKSFHWVAASASHSENGDKDLTGDESFDLIAIGLWASGYGSGETITVTMTTYDDVGGAAGSGTEGESISVDIEGWGVTGSVGARVSDGTTTLGGAQLNVPAAGYLGMSRDSDGNPEVHLKLVVASGTGPPSSPDANTLYGFTG